MDRPRLLVIQHQDNCGPALYADWLRVAGLELDVLRPDRGDAVPADAGGHAGLLVLGGAMGAHDDAKHPWLIATKALLRHAVARRTPTLGICLGHQLTAVAHGGLSERNPGGQTAGVRPVGWRPGAERDPVFGPVSRVGRAAVPHWNSDVVTQLPPDATVLAATEEGASQVARFGPCAWGVQFHPEADHSVVSLWADEDRADAARRGLDVDAALQQVKEAEDRLHATGSDIADAFARVVLDSR